MDDDARIKRAEHLFWMRSASYLRGGEYQDLSGIWAACLRDAGLEPSAWSMLAAPGDADLETKALTKWALELKEAADGTLLGYAACYSKDLVDDVIQPGAFTKSLAAHTAFARQHKSATLLPLLWQHDKNEPIGGVLEAKEDRRGLRCRYAIDRDIPRGKQAYNGLKAGYLSFSIGYRPVKYEWKGRERHLSEIALAEVSAVSFPANRDARALAGEE